MHFACHSTPSPTIAAPREVSDFTCTKRWRGSGYFDAIQSSAAIFERECQYIETFHRTVSRAADAASNRLTEIWARLPTMECPFPSIAIDRERAQTEWRYIISRR